MIQEGGKSPGEGGRVRPPLAFIPNVGQTDERAHYYAKGPDHAIYFTPDSVVFALKEFALFLRFVDADPQVRLEGRRQREGKAHVFAGSDPSRWQTDLPVYGELLYRNLWPGIDGVVQGERGGLKCGFTVQPGARLEHIRLAFQGARDLALDDYGNLVIHAPDGLLLGERPAGYQVIDGEKIPVACDFVLEQDAGGDLYVSFEAGPGYEPAYPLIMEPGLTYAAYLGGSVFGSGNAIALDAAGNVYVAGTTTSLGFPAGPGAFRPGGGSDVFVAKLNAQGNLVYAAYLGGSGDDTVTGMAVDEASGHAYVTGATNSSDFPVTFGACQTALAGGFDAFAAKLRPDGSGLEYSTYLGGAGIDIAHAITVVAGSAYITGTDSEDFPATPGAFQRSKAGDGDAFIVKLNASGMALEYSTYLGGPRASGGTAVFSAGLGIGADAEGNVCVGGNTTSPHFPVTPGAAQKVHGGSGDAFLTVLNAAGNALLYSAFLGGSESDAASGIAIDAEGRVYMTGNTASADFPVIDGAVQPMAAGGPEALIVRIEPVLEMFSPQPEPQMLATQAPPPLPLPPIPPVMPQPLVLPPVARIKARTRRIRRIRFPRRRQGGRKRLARKRHGGARRSRGRQRKKSLKKRRRPASASAVHGLTKHGMSRAAHGVSGSEHVVPRRAHVVSRRVHAMSRPAPVKSDPPPSGPSGRRFLGYWRREMNKWMQLRYKG